VSGPATVEVGHDLAVAGYEDLRHHVVAGAVTGGHVGLILILREGIAGWLARRPSCVAASWPRTPPDRHGARVVGDAIQTDLVRVLASMALAGREGRRA